MHRIFFIVIIHLPLLLISYSAIGETEDQTFTEAPFHFDLPGQSLVETLLEFSIQSKINVVIDSKQLKDHHSSPVVGLFTPASALQQLLSRAPFDFTYDQRLGSIIIIAKALETIEPAPLVITEKEFASDIEEVVVAGIRASLLRAMEIKFQSIGIVDAITEEDIGKFPDSNLAESLQRISGVTISYSNNEGDKINVRGFDSDFNLVLLNGRQMPTADVNSDVSSGTRSFNFADLASENIAAIEVFKNSSADQPTGGIGSVINIKTARPFDLKSSTASFGIKGIADTSNVIGNDITPELYGLFSTKSEEERFGFLLSGSYQARDSRSDSAKMKWSKGLSIRLPDSSVPEEITNTDESIWYPRELRYIVTDYERVRTNAQAVFQYSPSSRFTSTFDYTFSSLDIKKSGAEFIAGFSGMLAEPNFTLNDSFTISQATETGGNYNYEKVLSETENINDSFGINLNFYPSDAWSLQLDMHSSTAKLHPKGGGNRTALRVSAENEYSQSFNTSFDIPQISYRFVDQYDESGNPLVIRDNIEINDFIRNIGASAEWTTMESNIKQAQFDGMWENLDSEGFFQQVKFGLAKTVMNNHSTSADYIIPDPFSGVGENLDFYDPSVFSPIDTSDILDQFDGGLSQIPFIYDFDILELAEVTQERLIRFNRQNEITPNFPYRVGAWSPLGAPTDNPREDNTIRESTTSAFLQFKMATQTRILPIELLTGIRYEKTKLYTHSFFSQPTGARWTFPGAIFTEYGNEKASLSNHADYGELLPSLSARISLTDSLITRFAFSKTITRPDMNFLRAEDNLTSPSGRGERTAFQSSPSLSPYSSKNYDLSLDWYHGESNYVSLGFYLKKVAGFPRNVIEEKPIFGITDVYSGPRAEGVRATLLEEGIELTDENVFNRLVELYATDDSNPTIIGDETDPFLLFNVSTAVNSGMVNIHGWEFSFQQLFWDSGFGTVFNYTHVESDVNFGFENISDDKRFDTSFPSSSDFCNLVVFYDKHGLQVRFAYHWNDEYPLLTESIAGVVPVYTQSYGQWDGLISYTWDETLTVFIEGINLTDEVQRTYNGDRDRFASAEQFAPRYHFGMRYSF